MFLKSNFYRVALTICLVLSMFGLTFADTIRLKDGSIIKGKIVSFGEGKFTIVIGDGTRQRQMNFFADEIDSIEFESVSMPTTANVKTSLPTNNDNTAKKETQPKTNTVITVGQPEIKPTPQPTPSKSVIITDKTTQSNTNTPTNQTPTNTTIITNPTNTTSNVPTVPVKSDTQSKAITLNVKVLADNTANGWTNSGWVVKKGQKIRISGKGQINLGNGRYSSAAGVSSLPDKDKLVQTEATGGLLAVIGDDNNEFVFIGASREFIAPRDGALFLGINEGNLDDNSGSFEVTIEIQPN
jgi:PA-IL-like protein